MTATSTTIRRRLPQSALAEEAIRRFGPDPLAWRYRCPRCGHTQTAGDCRPGYRNRVALGCLNCGLVAEEADERVTAALWLVKIPGVRKPSPCFPLADDLDAPGAALSPVRDSGGPGVPERAPEPPTPPTVPARTPHAPTPPAAYWTAQHGWTDAVAIGDCVCAALGHLAPCGWCASVQVCEHCPTEVLVLADDMDAHLAAIHPEIAESEA